MFTYMVWSVYSQTIIIRQCIFVWVTGYKPFRFQCGDHFSNMVFVRFVNIYFPKISTCFLEIAVWFHIFYTKELGVKVFSDHYEVTKNLIYSKLQQTLVTNKQSVICSGLNQLGLGCFYSDASRSIATVYISQSLNK